MKIKDGVLELIESGDVVDGVFVIPENVKIKNVAMNAFWGHQDIKKIVIKGRIDNVDKAFHYCTNLEEVSFSEKICFIERGAFRDCKKLRKVEFSPYGYTNVCYAAFWGCDSLPSEVAADILEHGNIESLVDISDHSVENKKKRAIYEFHQSVRNVFYDLVRYDYTLKKSNYSLRGVTSCLCETLQECGDVDASEFESIATRVIGMEYNRYYQDIENIKESKKKPERYQKEEKPYPAAQKMALSRVNSAINNILDYSEEVRYVKESWED